MALYEKNPGNSKTERYAFLFVKIAGIAFICAGLYGLYLHLPMAISKQVILGWAILNITWSIDTVILGIGLLVCYKKSVHIWSRFWIFIPFMIFFTTTFLKDLIYYEPTALRITSEAAYVFAFLIAIAYWFYYRKKYPEEFGLKS